MDMEALNHKINAAILQTIFDEDKTGQLKVISEVMCKHGLPPENLLPCLLEMSACISGIGVAKISTREEHGS